MPRQSRARAALAGAIVLLAQTAAAGERSCADIAATTSGMRITRADSVAAGTLPTDNPGRAALTGAARQGAAMPAHCRIDGAIGERIGVGGATFATGFELRLPDQWNGKMLFQGGGGMDGVVGEAIGAIPFAGATTAPALSRGYAVVSTDSGHQGRDGGDSRFAVDQQARIDHAYGAIGTVAVAARALVEARYGRPAAHSYYMGCSNGGRTAMMAAQRFPALFDGVVAGNPGFRLSHAAIGQAWNVAAFSAAAPLDATGRPVLAAALSDADLALVAAAVLRRCDGADGLVDGSVDAMSACRFDPIELQCADTKTPTCLAASQVAALRRVWAGAHDGAGGALYAGWPWDPGIASRGWRAWQLGTSQTAAPNALNATITSGSLGQYFITPPVAGLDLASVDFDRIAAQTAQTAAINDPTSTFLSSFVAGGGRLLVVQGNADPVFSADDIRAYWRSLVRDNAGAEALAAWARLFIVPGMTHCGGGPALDDFDPLAAIEAWVEHGQPPDRLVAHGAAFPGRSRPICPYPMEAHYIGAGDSQEADSFACR